MSTTPLLKIKNLTVTYPHGPQGKNELKALDQISIENMDQQRDEFLQQTSPASTSASNSSLSAIITIAIGEGIHELFRSVGASEVIEGGSTMNPSVEQIVASINGASLLLALISFFVVFYRAGRPRERRGAAAFF